MDNLLVMLFAMLDSGAWTVSRAAEWADATLRDSTAPRPWISEMACSESADMSLEAIRTAMQDSGVTLPPNVGDLIGGLVLLRFDRGELSERECRKLLIDVVDAYGSTDVDPELASEVDLNDAQLGELRLLASTTELYLSGSSLRIANRDLLEG